MSSLPKLLPLRPGHLVPVGDGRPARPCYGCARCGVILRREIEHAPAVHTTGPFAGLPVVEDEPW